MLIAQMTDIHIGFDPDARPEELNRIRFRSTLERLIASPNPIDMLVLTGDLDRRAAGRLSLPGPCDTGQP